MRNQRRDFHHQAARALVNRFGTVVLEDLKITNMTKAPEPKPDPEQEGAYLPNGAAAKAGLNTSILDAGWGQFQALCVAKAASAGRHVVLVDPHNTSQVCSGCGKLVPKPLEERTHCCPRLGPGDRPRPQRRHQHPSGLEEANGSTGPSKPLAQASGYFTQVMRSHCYYNPQTGEVRDQCYPAVPTIAKECGVDPATIHRLIQRNPKTGEFLSKNTEALMKFSKLRRTQTNVA